MLSTSTVEDLARSMERRPWTTPFPCKMNGKSTESIWDELEMPLISHCYFTKSYRLPGFLPLINLCQTVLLCLDHLINLELEVPHCK